MTCFLGLGLDNPIQKTPKINWVKKTHPTWIGYYAIYDVDKNEFDIIVEWCKENCSGMYQYYPELAEGKFSVRIIYMSKESDATAFKLRWS